MLHEGLGSAALWGDFPDKLASGHRPRRLGLFARRLWRFVAGRNCRGRSTTCTARRSTCAALLDAIGFPRGILFGHSDGASIAAIYAGGRRSSRERRGADRAAFHREDYRLHRSPRSGLRNHRACARSSRAGTPMSTTPFTAGMVPGLIPIRDGTSANTSLHPCSPRDYAGRRRPIWHRQIESRGKSVIAPSMLRYPDAGHSPHRDAPEADAG